MEIVKVQNLCKTYGKGETRVDALKNVSLSLNEMWVHSPPLGAQANFNRIEKHDTM